MVATSGIRKSSIVPKNGPGAMGVTVKPTDGRIYMDRGNGYPETLASSGAKLQAEAITLTAKQDGLTLFLNDADGFTVTLPAPALGLKFKFVVKTAPTTAYVIAGHAANLIVGQTHSSTGGDADSETTPGATEMNFVASTAVQGDWAEFVSDGTYWYAQAFSNADGGVTFTN